MAVCKDALIARIGRTVTASVNTRLYILPNKNKLSIPLLIEMYIKGNLCSHQYFLKKFYQSFQPKI